MDYFSPVYPNFKVYRCGSLKPSALHQQFVVLFHYAVLNSGKFSCSVPSSPAHLEALLLCTPYGSRRKKLFQLFPCFTMPAGAMKPAERAPQPMAKSTTSTSLSLPGCSCSVLCQLIQSGMAEKKVQQGNWCSQWGSRGLSSSEASMSVQTPSSPRCPQYATPGAAGLSKAV